MKISESLRKSLVERGLRIEPATIEDLSVLVMLVTDLMSEQPDFNPDETAQSRGIELILESPARGRIFVIRNDDEVVGMVNLLFSISTAQGGFVLIMEDVIIRPEYRGQGLGTIMLHYVEAFAKEKNFKRITLLADRLNESSQEFFKKQGYELSGLVPLRKVF